MAQHLSRTGCGTESISHAKLYPLLLEVWPDKAIRSKIEALSALVHQIFFALSECDEVSESFVICFLQSGDIFLADFSSGPYVRASPS